MDCPHCGFDRLPVGAHFCPNCRQPIPDALLARRAPALDFAATIAERTADFTGREWVFRAVDDWLADPAGARVFLLTGAPGCGKTAIAARLVQFALGSAAPPEGLSRLGPGFLDAYHFCAAQRPDWISPHTFAESLSLQLAGHRECAAALVALRGRRLAPGEFPIQVVHLNVGQLHGQAVGFVNIIQHLDAGAAPAEEVFVRLIMEPLAAYLDVHPSRRAILLVDALDEALRYSGKAGIVTMMSWAHALHRGARLILTTRPESAVLAAVRTMAVNECSLTADVGFARSLDDVEQYVLATLERRPALAHLLAPDMTREAFARSVQAKCRGSLGMARNLLDRLVEQGLTIQPELVEAQPDQLAAAYRAGLRRLTGGDLDLWERRVEPVLGTLAVAQAALEERQLAAITGRHRSQVRRTLTGLLPYLDRDETLPASRRTYALKDYSFTSFLLDEDEPEEYWCEEPLQHQRFTAHLKSLSGDWSRCDAYSLEYAAHHLLRAGQTRDLELILTKAFSDASARYFGWHMPFVRNLEQALDAIEPERAARLCLDIVYGPQPNSLVNQRILYLLRDRIRPLLRDRGSPFGRPNSTRDRAVDRALGLLSQPVEIAVSGLADLYHQASGPVRGFIALALGASKSPLATPLLLGALEQEERAVAWCVADGLLDLDDRSVIPLVISLYDAPSTRPGLQQRILYLLGRMQAADARVLIPKGLQHPNRYAKARAVDMLWLLAPVEGAEEMLWTRLGFDPKGPEHDTPPMWDNEYLQHRLVTALGRVGTARSVDHLIHFQRVWLPGQPQPETVDEQRERRRLEESLKRAISSLQRVYPGTVPPANASHGRLVVPPGVPA